MRITETTNYGHFMRVQPLAIVFMLMCMGATAAADQPASLVLAKDGVANAIIVIAEKPSRAAADGAKILSEHLRQVTGAAFPIVREDQIAQVEARPPVKILVGASQFTKLL